MCTIAGAKPIYRLVITVLEHAQAAAEDVAAIYHGRCEIETAFGERKTYLRGAKIVLCGRISELNRIAVKTPKLEPR